MSSQVSLLHCGICSILQSASGLSLFPETSNPMHSSKSVILVRLSELHPNPGPLLPPASVSTIPTHEVATCLLGTGQSLHRPPESPSNSWEQPAAPAWAHQCFTSPVLKLSQRQNWGMQQDLLPTNRHCRRSHRTARLGNELMKLETESGYCFVRKTLNSVKHKSTRI